MPQPATAQSRVCSICKSEKDASQFNKDKQQTSGLHSYCKPCRATLHLKRVYGLNDHQYKEMVRTTPHCPICGSEEPLVVDHDHSTQEVRGLICNSCNLGLGKFKDNIQSLKNAIAYLNNEPLSETTSAKAKMDTSTDN